RKTPDRIVHAWDRTVERDGVAHRINRDHPLVLALEGTLSDEQAHLFDELLRFVEESLPFDALCVAMASELRPATRTRDDDEDRDLFTLEIGRASCRERGEISVVAVS